MIPTVEQIKTDALGWVDDDAGTRFLAPVQQWGFKAAYLTLADCFLLYQIPKIKKIVLYSVAANATSFYPADASISDFGELISMEERTDGSSERYQPVLEVNTLPQRDPATVLMEFEWRDDGFFFLGATTARQVRITFYGSGNPPTTGTVGIDGSDLVLAKLTAAFMAPRKGDPELGQQLMNQAVGPNFQDGRVGGDAMRLIQPMVRAQQRVPVAPRPFRAGGQRLRMNSRFFVSPAFTAGSESMIDLVIAGAINGTDGTDGNTVFTLDQNPAHLTLYKNGVKQKMGISYTYSMGTIIFISPNIPLVGDLLDAEGTVAPSSGSSSSSSSGGGAMHTFTISGAINGNDGTNGNAVFVLNEVPTFLELSRNGNIQTPGIAYTLSGQTVTFLIPNIPTTGDSLLARGQS